MPHADLSDFLADVDRAGELVRVPVEVNPALEVAAITTEVCGQSDGGPALLFENVRGCSMPVATNLLGSERRLSIALHAESLVDAESRVARLLRPEIEEGWLGSLKMLPQLAQLTKMPPKLVKTGRSQQVVNMGRDIDLRGLPFLQCWPRERAATITSAQVVTQHPQTGDRHVGSFPLSVAGQDSLALHWSPQDIAGRHFRGYQDDQRQMPVAIVLGGDPLLSFLAAAPLPAEADAYLLAGYFRDANVELVKGRTVDLLVPAAADLVIEGLIDPETTPETTDAIALSTGYYSLPEACRTLNVTAVTHRSNPVLPSLVPGPPPAEQTWIDRAVVHLLRPIVRMMFPEIVDLHCPSICGDRSVVFVSIRKSIPQQARQVMNALWGFNGFATAKWIVVVDADLDVRDEALVWFTMAANTHPRRDVLLSDGPASFHDHAAPSPGLGQKIGIDATRKETAEGHPREWPEMLQLSRQMRALVEQRWQEYGFNRDRR